MTERVASRASRWPLWLRRGRLEAVAMALIGLGVVMLMQPLSVALYSYSFITILAGTLGFVIVSHFPD
jgi:CO dehydrogenase/acetyl-CoA synthase delta subunit